MRDMEPRSGVSSQDFTFLFWEGGDFIVLTAWQIWLKTREAYQSDGLEPWPPARAGARAYVLVDQKKAHDCKTVECLKQFARSFTHSDLGWYGPLDNNSNTYCRSALGACGINQPMPPGAYGWGPTSQPALVDWSRIEEEHRRRERAQLLRGLPGITQPIRQK